MSHSETREDSKTPRRRSPLRRLVLVLGVILLLAGTATGGAMWWLTDRPVTAPGWLRDRIEARIAENASGLRVEFGRMQITLHQGWRPELRLRDVAFRTVAGRPLMTLSDLQATLAMRPLLRGQVQPKTVALSGIFATLRRAPDGQLSLVASSDATAFAWQAATLPDLVGQLDAVFQRPQMAALTQLDVDAVTLRLDDARARRAWTVDGARLRVRRAGRDLRLSADLAILGGGAQVATMEANYDSPIGDRQAQFGITVANVAADDIAAFSPAFGWLGGLQAPISGALRGGVDPAGDLAPVNATLQIGAGVLQPTKQTRPVPFDVAQAYVTFDPAANELVFDQLSIDSPWVSGQLEGRARLSGLEEGRLDEMIGQFRLSALVLDPPGLYPEPRRLEGAELDFRLRPDPFRLELGQARIVDRGRSMLAEGELEAGPNGWRLAVDGRMSQIAPDRLLALWPPGVKPKTRDWLAQNLLAGTLRDVQFALRQSPDRPAGRPDAHLSFAFDAAKVRVVKTVPPVTGARGVASLLRDRFVVAVEQGGIAAPQGGWIDLAGSSFIIPDVTVKGGAPAVARLRTDSTITAALSLLDRKPLRILRQSNLPVTVAGGRAAMQVNLALPLVKGVKTDQIDFDVSGTLRDLTSTVLVPDHVLAAPRLDVVAANDLLEISGRGTFDGIPVTARWSNPLGSEGRGQSRVVADVELSSETAEILQIGLPPGTLDGLGQGRLQLDLESGAPPRFALQSDLTGLSLSVPALGWLLSRGDTGDLRISGTLGARPSVDRLELAAPGLNAAGRIRLRDGGGLETADFDRVRVGGWLDAPVRLVGRGRGVPPAVQVRGGTLDLRRARLAGGGGGGQSGPISLSLDRLQINDTIALTDVQGDFSANGGLQGNFRGRINGAARVTGEVTPQDGRSAVRLRSDDAGAVFAAAGLLKQARGGDMTLSLQPVGTAGAFNGALSVRDTRVRDAPAIAALINAVSVVGLLEQLNGQGLHFAEVDAAFRLTPDKVTLTEASAVGPSIGLSMDGTYDVNRAVLDMRGVFSPIYLINGVGSVLTRRGEGVIGFNFRLSGPAQEPRVQVNPLSALTPSIFRDLFRSAPPEVAVEPGEGPGAAPRLPETPTRDRGPVAPRGGNR